MCWVVPSLQSQLRKMKHLFYLWSFSAADAKCVWISGEHFHLSLRGAGSSLTESARTNFLELSFLLVCETEVISVTGIIHLLNTALVAGESLLFNSFMYLSAPVHQGKFATGRGFPRAGMGMKCTERELTCAWAGIQCTAPSRCHQKGNVHTRSRRLRLFLPQTKQEEWVQHKQGINCVLVKLSVMETWQRRVVIPLRFSYCSYQELPCPRDQWAAYRFTAGDLLVLWKVLHWIPFMLLFGTESCENVHFSNSQWSLKIWFSICFMAQKTH